MNRWHRALMIETKTPCAERATAALNRWPLTRRKHFGRLVDQALGRGAQPILLGDADYPRGWLRLAKPPVGAWLIGQSKWAGERVGIVGARAAPPKVRRRVVRYAAWVARRQGQVVSGAAVGVDQAAHEGVEGVGSLAVVPFGIEASVTGQGQIAERLIVGETGGVWCSALLRHGARARYVARNQLLAALCDSLVVAYAAPRSGSMHTVRFAQALGLPIEAWWDPSDPPSNDGCRSIHQGALPSDPQLLALLKDLVQAKGRVGRLAPDLVGDRALRLFELECEGWIRKVGAGQFECFGSKDR